MIGLFVKSRAQRQQAEAYRRMALRAMAAQDDAADRAIAEAPYRWALVPPPIERRCGKWFAIIEAGVSVPKVEKRPVERIDPR